MPTKEQLYRSWESDFKFGLSNLDTRKSIPEKKQNESGETIGEIEFDPKNQDLKIIVKES